MHEAFNGVYTPTKHFPQRTPTQHQICVHFRVENTEYFAVDFVIGTIPQKITE